ncbi:MAG: TetR/AcrR family transcriptional regulator [Deltaproteobacteria bacterium]|jgi:AcrR family transcriptional regulator|nr:TetR/AcrR family transcriptional regulator [Deltaproteobacteria bacterium]
MGIHERKLREREQRRRQILKAARKVFSSNGFTKTTMEDIAREAELSPGTLYLYFKNKDELYASLSVEVLEHLHERLKRVYIKEAPNSQLRINDLKQMLYNVYQVDPLILLNLFHLQSSEILTHLEPAMLTTIRNLSSNSLGIITKIFAEGVNDHVFIEKNPKTLSDVLWGLFSGVVLWEESKRIISNKRETSASAFDTAFDIFLRGIAR